MTTVQIIYIGGLISVAVLIAWFSMRVVAAAIKVEGAAGLWQALRQAGPRWGEVMDAGKLAYCGHRISGFAIFAFLFLHVLNVSLISISHQLYDEVHVLYTSTPMRVMECFLLLAILFHTFNGLRLISLDFLDISQRAAEHLLRIVFWLTLVVGLAGGTIILAPVFR